MKKYLWMKVDLDNNEEPLAVADTTRELAKMCGVKRESIMQMVSRARRKGWKCSYIKIEDDEDDYQTDIDDAWERRLK